MEQTRERQTGTASSTQSIDKINACLRSGEYARSLDLVRSAAADGPEDAELASLEKLAQDGLKRKAEADRLITESQELFAQQKSAEAIQLLRQAYELDKKNSLARTILANALAEHAQSVVETDWLKAETLTNQALALNPAHPTAKTILSAIVHKKETSPVDDWVLQASKLHSSGDLFGALAWVAEGLAVHPHDPKLLQIQEAVQRDQGVQRRQARRGDLEDLRRMQREIDGAKDLAAKQALAVRIQEIAAKHWTDGEILSIANALLLRLGLVAQDNSSASARKKGATVILHVPRPSAPEASRVDTRQIPPSPAPSSPAAPEQVSANEITTNQVSTNPVSTKQTPPMPVAPSSASPAAVSSETIPVSGAPSSKVSLSRVPARILPRGKVRSTSPKPQPPREEEPLVSTVEPTAPAVKVISQSPRKTGPTSSSSTTLILTSIAAIVLVGATFFFTRRHYSGAPKPAPVSENNSALGVPVPSVSNSPVSSAATDSTPAQATPESSGTAAQPSDAAGTPMSEDHPPAESNQKLGTLLVIAGQDNASVFLNGQLQRQLTKSGQLRLPNLEPKDYVVQVSKTGFQDSPQQKVRIRKGEQARVIFKLQAQPQFGALNIQGGAPGTTVFVDQNLIGTIQQDGTLSASTVNPGDHTIELRKERYKSRQFKKHFVAGGTISLAAADTALEAAPAELKITFTPPDAKVALVKGESLTIVSSGVPLNLAPGTYTLTARTADRFTRSSTLEIAAGQFKALDLSLAPNGMSKWADPGAWKQEKDTFTRKGGDFVLYGVAPAAGTFIFSATPAKGHLLQWMLNYTDSRNYVLFQMDDNNFYRTVIRNGGKSDQIIVPHKVDKKSFRTVNIRVTATEVVHQIKNGNSWMVLDRYTLPGTNLGLGKFGFYIPGSDEVALSSFAHYADLNIR